MEQRYLDDILYKAENGISLSSQEIIHLLTLKDTGSVKKVMKSARKLREQYFTNKVFLYGFIYFSTYCKNHCTFCFYRKTNKLSPRYRKNLLEVVDIAGRLADSGVHLVDLTMGEDPDIFRTDGFDILLEMVARVKDNTGLPVMISPGVVPDDILIKMNNAGVTWYALYQETHNPVLFKKLRIGQSFKVRRDKRLKAGKQGMLVEDGMLLGVGETNADRADSILGMKREGVHQARVMSLVPQLQTPMAGRVVIPRINEYLCIAVMRLVMPDRLIPASLDVDGIKGLEMRLEAGANVVTSIIPPSSSLAGVSQSTLDIEQGLRAVPEVKKILTGKGLEAASADEYTAWTASQKRTKITREDDYDENRDSGRTASGA
ncbi:MAG: methylornithine synthase PylB [Firmicutes bacterium HGW-Firmicutes-14]|nr:MAG: methylornithine synthase PylB [Firmicutes bacterium HGW-Firmicutes-14]